MRLRWLLAGLALSACAAERGHPARDSATGARAELVGYLVFSREFLVYPSEAAMRRGLHEDPPECISGRFPSFEQHESMSRRYHGRKVRLVGSYEDWAPFHERLLAGDPIAAASALLQNLCNQERVFIAVDAFPVD